MASDVRVSHKGHCAVLFFGRNSIGSAGRRPSSPAPQPAILLTEVLKKPRPPVLFVAGNQPRRRVDQPSIRRDAAAMATRRAGTPQLHSTPPSLTQTRGRERASRKSQLCSAGIQFHPQPPPPLPALFHNSYSCLSLSYSLFRLCLFRLHTLRAPEEEEEEEEDRRLRRRHSGCLTGTSDHCARSESQGMGDASSGPSLTAPA